MKKLIPVLLLAFGTGVGIVAGLLLVPSKQDMAKVDNCSVPSIKPAAELVESIQSGPAAGREYVKLNNQFVIPVMGDDFVQALVVASLSMEVTTGTTERVYSTEPKLRDVFLQVLFDHANIGGFEGRFTDADRMLTLREALRDAARSVMGSDVSDVLITEIARQDA